MPAEPNEPLTDRQRDIFNWMLGFTLENLYQPSFREIAEKFGINSPNGVAAHMKALAKKGYIAPTLREGRAVRFLRRTLVPAGAVRRMAHHDTAARDVARFRVLLAARGVEASDADIALAYSAHSEAVYAVGWLDHDRPDEAGMIQGLIDNLEDVP